MNNEPQLLPCPCGCPAELKQGHRTPGWWAVVARCGMQTPACSEKSRAIGIWNGRTGDNSATKDLAELRELYTLMLCAARRCARDLDHATGMLGMHDAEGAKRFEDRATHWKDVFHNTVNYRHHLHERLQTLERTVEAYQRGEQPL